MNTMPNIAGTQSYDDNNIDISFGWAGSITTIPNGGIDLNDGEHVSWTEQQTVWFEIIPRWPVKDLNLRLSASPFLVPGKISFQQVSVYVNGLFCGLTNLFESQECNFHIPRNAVSGRATRITLAIPTAISPKHLDLSEDVRTLGIAITAVCVSAK
ncbi:MAG: hypothetical protein B7Z58_07690 [Acidiphilium sp. 37-64-53]|uniref:hypothetical protein n=1 Tax=Acidiphilium TaxID=522 RepID=UPI000BD8389C|nr:MULTISPECIES: hypothetical protein [Acidiphilium]OYW02469.1 MAG: hypothetical protein B7Z58_07690 [Acidiphilium sp. 37-64-53]OZB30256.1 MAG: hypothetical protein B7X49_03820 [Acidiphilium sp. 34-64-41]HQT84425.1 hypothetical protein [Acidiphilium rubrum]